MSFSSYVIDKFKVCAHNIHVKVLNSIPFVKMRVLVNSSMYRWRFIFSSSWSRIKAVAMCVCFVNFYFIQCLPNRNSIWVDLSQNKILFNLSLRHFVICLFLFIVFWSVNFISFVFNFDISMQKFINSNLNRKHQKSLNFWIDNSEIVLVRQRNVKLN